MFKKVDASLNFLEREREILKFWKENDIFNKSLKINDEDKVFSMYDGPPTANGKPHIGHILTRVYKDIFPRFKTMQGFTAPRKAGWDTHGLPVELEVEKALGLDGKKDIERYGVLEFTEKCRESVFKYKGEWEDMSERVGYFMDTANPYITLDNNYIESVWWALKTIYDKGMIYKGHKIVPYCPRCGTALSSHELAQGYKDVTDRSIVARFRTSFENRETFLLAWTTTPWTLPSNAALCVNQGERYALVESEGARYILAENLIEKHFEKFTLIKTFLGSHILGLKYQPLFDYVADKHKDTAFYVVGDDFVTLDSGTGIVHIAPAFGEDDAAVGRKNSLPFIQLIDERGNFKEEAGELKGQFCKNADKNVIKNLKERGLLHSELAYLHKYPYCWRCDTVLIYYARESWFIKMSELRERLLENNKSINWLPPQIGEGRMANFLEGAVDWAISRERYWGTPLPFWVCPKCNKVRAIESREELNRLAKSKSKQNNSFNELHRPMLDDAVIECECGAMMERTPEVLDCWFDSGCMPFAQMHYPFENKELFEKTFPADYISEAVDQTRGWFYSLLAISTLLFDRAPFKNCLVLGLVCDENGVKMSKHKGNVISSSDALNEAGADAVRWFLTSSNAPYLASKVSLASIGESARRMMGTLWNTYAFFALYAATDGFDLNKHKLDLKARTLMDKWILSKLNTLILSVTNKLEAFNVLDAAREIEEFVDVLSNWYVRRSRDRFWASEMEGDKAAAYHTLHTVLLALAKLIAPITPFLAETLYLGLEKGESAPLSVHLTSYPISDLKLIDIELEKKMDKVLDITVLGRAARNAKAIKNRQPLAKLSVASAEQINLDEELLSVIKDELNVKGIEFIADEAELVTFELKPQLKTLGPKYGAKLGKIRALLSESADKVYKAVKQNGIYKGEDFELTLDDVLVSVVSREGTSAESGRGITVILDTFLTRELIEEGFVRELLSKIQAMRKEADYAISDRIQLSIMCDPLSAEVIERFRAHIMSEVLGEKLFVNQDAKLKSPFGAEAAISSKQLKIEISRSN